MQSSSEFSGVSEDSQVPFSGVWVAISHFPQSGVVTILELYGDVCNYCLKFHSDVLLLVMHWKNFPFFLILYKHHLFYCWGHCIFLCVIVLSYCSFGVSWQLFMWSFAKRWFFSLIDNIFIFMIVVICSKLGVLSFVLFFHFVLFCLHCIEKFINFPCKQDYFLLTFCIFFILVVYV